MAVPEGYTKLGRIGFVDKGYYDAKTQYDKGDVVLYEGSSYIALKDGMTGVTPQDDKKNWRYMARGFEADRLEHITASDVQKLCGKLDYDPDAQSLIDVIADLVANKLLKREDVVANLTTATAGKALDATQGKVLKESIKSTDKSVQEVSERVSTNEDDIDTLKTKVTQLNSDKVSVSSMTSAYAQGFAFAGQGALTDVKNPKIAPGIYRVEPSAKNLPVSTYGIVLCMRDDTAGWMQIIFIPTDNTAAYLRFYNSAIGGAWTSWRKIASA